MPASTLSDFNVEVVQVGPMLKHPNADTLSVTKVHGADCVVKTADFQPGELAIFIPVDGMVPTARTHFGFLASKSHPDRTHARIRAMKLRGIYSEGLLVPVDAYGPGWSDLREGDNVQERMGVVKYEPAPDPETRGPAALPNSKRSLIARVNRIMPVYGVDSIYRMAACIPHDTWLLGTEQIHGTNARFSWSEGRFWIGSHRTLRSVTAHRFVEWLRGIFGFLWSWLSGTQTGFYKDGLGDVWCRVAADYGLEEKCAEIPDHVVYGEIYGPGIQKRGGISFDYDAAVRATVVGQDQPLGFCVFDIYDRRAEQFLSHTEMVAFCRYLGLETVPHVVSLRYDYGGLAALEPCALGPTMLGAGQHIREGVVWRSDVYERDRNRVLLKMVSRDYKMLENGED